MITFNGNKVASTQNSVSLDLNYKLLCVYVFTNLMTTISISKKLLEAFIKELHKISEMFYCIVS